MKSNKSCPTQSFINNTEGVLLDIDILLGILINISSDEYKLEILTKYAATSGDSLSGYSIAVFLCTIKEFEYKARALWVLSRNKTKFDITDIIYIINEVGSHENVFFFLKTIQQKISGSATTLCVSHVLDKLVLEKYKIEALRIICKNVVVEGDVRIIFNAFGTEKAKRLSRGWSKNFKNGQNNLYHIVSGTAATGKSENVTLDSPCSTKTEPIRNVTCNNLVHTTNSLVDTCSTALRYDFTMDGLCETGSVTARGLVKYSDWWKDLDIKEGYQRIQKLQKDGKCKNENTSITDTLPIPEKSLCVVCMEHERNVVLPRCGHLCLCDMCADKISKSSQKTISPTRTTIAKTAECPVCRQTSDTWIKVYNV